MCVKDFLTQTITIKRKTNSTNTSGERVPSWETQTTIKGCIMAMTAKETYMRDKLPMNVSHVMYYTSTEPNSDDRVYYASEHYLIKGIENKMTGYPSDGYKKAYLERVEVTE
jgi:head-tail adaptor